MNITQHIKALLYRHDCVIVPGFGAFLAQYQSAKFDEVQNLFYPPNRTIQFNAQLQNNDGLLLSYLENTQGLNYVEAKNAIQDFVADVEITLDKQGKVEFKDLGCFTYQNENQLVFEPYSTNFLLDAFGLEGITNTPISRQPKTLSTAEEHEPKVVELSSANTTSSRYLKYAAVGLIAFGIAGALGFNWYTNDVKEHNLQVQNTVQQKVNNAIEKAEFSIMEPLPSLKIQTKAPVEIKNIHIVGGAFREEANAIKKLKQLQQQGFDAQLIGMNKYGLHQVAFSSFSDVEEAKLQLRKIKRNHLPAAWLLIQ